MNSALHDPSTDFGTLTLFFGVLHGVAHMARTINDGHADALVKKPIDRSGLAALFFIVPIAFPMLLVYMKKTVSHAATLARALCSSLVRWFDRCCRVIHASQELPYMTQDNTPPGWIPVFKARLLHSKKNVGQVSPTASRKRVVVWCWNRT